MLCKSISYEGAKYQFQGQHRIYFDCIKVKTGTTKAVLETDLRAKYSYLPECKLGDINERMCFANTIRPFSSAANVDARK